MAGAAAASLVVGLQLAGVFGPADRALEDGLLALAQLRGQADDVAVVAVDPHSLRSLPDWPWSRSVYADVLRTLDEAGASVVAFDIDFSTARDRAGDEAFAGALAESGRGVLATFRQVQELAGVGQLEVASIPAPRLASAAAALGSVLVPVEADGVVRRATRSSEIGGQRLHSLAGAALSVALSDPRPPAPGFLTLDFRRQQPRPPVISLVDVLDGRFDPADVAGRVVFVGATAIELQDLWTTPLAAAEPGVFIQVAALRTLRAERAGEPVLRPAPLAARIAGVGLLSLCLVPLAAASRGHGSRLLWLLGTGLAVTLGSLVLLRSTGLLASPLPALCVVGLHYTFGLESLRSRVGLRLAAHESSLVALEHVSEATTARGDTGLPALDVALGLLGEGVGATRVVLLRGDDREGLEGRHIEWAPEDSPPAPEVDRRLAEQVLRERRSRVVEGHRPGWPEPGGSAVYSPLQAGEAAVGTLVVECAHADTLDTLQRRTIATVSAQLALSAHNLRLVEHLQRTFDSSIAALATAVEARDGYTDLHCRRLAAFSAVMADRLGLPPEQVHAIELGALLHDVGKIGICDAVLNKPGRFTPEERRDMQRHPEIGAGIVRPVHGLSETTLACVRHHHERWDGQGYPCGLAGEEIPLAARIVSVVDVWDALSSARPYKPAYPQEKVLEKLRKGRGVEFDPEIVDLFLAVLDEQGEEMLDLIEQHSSGSRQP